MGRTRQPAPLSELDDIKAINQEFINATFERRKARKRADQEARELRDAELTHQANAAKVEKLDSYDPVETGKRLMAAKIADAQRGNYYWRTGKPFKNG